MGDTGIGDQALDVLLSTRQYSTIDNAHQPECHGDRRKRLGLFREQRQRKPQDAVGGGFQQDTGQIDTAGGRRLGMGIRKPAMEWDHRQLHGKGHKEAQHQPRRQRLRDLGIQQGVVAEGQFAGVGVMHEHQ